RKPRADETRQADEDAAAPARVAAAEEARRAAEPAPAPAQPAPAAAAAAEDDARPRPRHGHGHVPTKRPEPARPSRGRDDRRQSGKLTVSRALGEDGDARARSLAALRRSREKEKRAHMPAGPSAKPVRDVVVPEAITVGELANRMAERAA